ncbi:hypothetical protein HDU96_006737 [Phlyctochytrium bullatum]|nr:hypothetical protein HDU96_006737 [Phlyctochytrium bullatum]
MSSYQYMNDYDADNARAADETTLTEQHSNDYSESPYTGDAASHQNQVESPQSQPVSPEDPTAIDGDALLVQIQEYHTKATEKLSSLQAELGDLFHELLDLITSNNTDFMEASLFDTFTTLTLIQNQEQMQANAQAKEHDVAHASTATKTKKRKKNVKDSSVTGIQHPSTASKQTKKATKADAAFESVEHEKDNDVQHSGQMKTALQKERRKAGMGKAVEDKGAQHPETILKKKTKRTDIAEPAGEAVHHPILATKRAKKKTKTVGDDVAECMDVESDGSAVTREKSGQMETAESEGRKTKKLNVSVQQDMTGLEPADESASASKKRKRPADSNQIQVDETDEPNKLEAPSKRKKKKRAETENQQEDSVVHDPQGSRMHDMEINSNSKDDMQIPKKRKRRTKKKHSAVENEEKAQDASQSVNSTTAASPPRNENRAAMPPATMFVPRSAKLRSMGIAVKGPMKTPWRPKALLQQPEEKSAAESASRENLQTSPTKDKALAPPILSSNNNSAQHDNADSKPPQEIRYPKYFAPFGNYDGYYDRRNNTPDSFKLDPRLRLLDKSIFKNARVLDIGCNSGEIPIQIALHTGALMVEGIDVDPDLIVKARRNLSYRASIVDFKDDGPPENDLGDANGFGFDEETDFFPASCPLSLGYMPVLRDGKPGFPRNVFFRCGNFVTEPLPVFNGDRPTVSQPSVEVLDPLLYPQKYDVILALSVTKWVHVIWGDEGLRTFFAKCYAALNSGGKLILEPQPMDKGYRRDRKEAIRYNMCKDDGKELKIDPNGFKSYLIDEIGFKSCRSLGNIGSGPKSFQKRELLLFER